MFWETIHRCSNITFWKNTTLSPSGADYVSTHARHLIWLKTRFIFLYTANLIKANPGRRQKQDLFVLGIVYNFTSSYSCKCCAWNQNIPRCKAKRNAPLHRCQLRLDVNFVLPSHLNVLQFETSAMSTGVQLPRHQSQRRSPAADTLPRWKLAAVLSC